MPCCDTRCSADRFIQQNTLCHSSEGIRKPATLLKNDKVKENIEYPGFWRIPQCTLNYKNTDLNCIFMAGVFRSSTSGVGGGAGIQIGFRPLVKLSSGSAYTTPEKVENAALFLRISLSSTLIRQEKRAFRKRSWNRRNLRTAVLCFLVDGKHFENGAFRDRWHHDNHVISTTEFFSNTNPNWQMIEVFLNFCSVVWTGPHVDRHTGWRHHITWWLRLGLAISCSATFSATFRISSNVFRFEQLFAFWAISSFLDIEAAFSAVIGHIYFHILQCFSRQLVNFFNFLIFFNIYFFKFLLKEMLNNVLKNFDIDA